MVQPPLISFHLISLYLPAYLTLLPQSISSATAESLSILFSVVSLAPSPVLWHRVDFQYVFVDGPHNLLYQYKEYCYYDYH